MAFKNDLRLTLSYGESVNHTNACPYQQELIELLKAYQYTPTDVWLGQKSFKMYGCTSQQVIEEIVKEIKEICAKLKAYKTPIVLLCL